MMDEGLGTWWHVRTAAQRVEVSHGVTVDGVPREARAVVLVSLTAALELAVGLVHACLEIDPEEAQATMLSLWVRQQN